MKIAGVTIANGGSPTVLANETLSSAGWSVSGDYYIYTFSNASIMPSSVITFTPNNASVTVCSTAMMMPQISTSAGTCTFYAQYSPGDDIIGTLTIQ